LNKEQAILFGKAKVFFIIKKMMIFFFKK